MQSLLLVLISCVLTAIGQVAFKYGMTELGPQLEEPGKNLIQVLYITLFNPVIIFGFACFGSGAVVWLFALSKLELGLAVPLSALTYIFILAASVLIFKEPITATKIAGTLLVASGVAVLSLG